MENKQSEKYMGKFSVLKIQSLWLLKFQFMLWLIVSFKLTNNGHECCILYSLVIFSVSARYIYCRAVSRRCIAACSLLITLQVWEHWGALTLMPSNIDTKPDLRWYSDSTWRAWECKHLVPDHLQSHMSPLSLILITTNPKLCEINKTGAVNLLSTQLVFAKSLPYRH